MNNKKAHLVYLTGLSIDKKRLNDIANNINTDIDFSYWLTEVQARLSSILQNKSHDILNQLQSNVNIVSIISKLYISNKFKNQTIENLIDPILGDILDAKSASFSFNKKLEYNFEDIIKDINIKSNNYTNANFFSLYLSHQSDSMAVSPLSKLSSKKNFNIINAYSDRPYYDNKYINHISLSLKKIAIKDEYQNIFQDFVESNFDIHCLDILLSKAIGEAKSNGYTYLNIVEGGITLKNLDDIQQSLKERNFFGITLLNQLIYNLEELIKNEQFQIDISNNEQEKEEFLKELFISSANPSNLEFASSSNIKANIFFSNGLDGDKSTKYFTEDDEYFHIKIPIKMFLSLPMNENEQVDSSLFIPYGIDSEDNDVVDIITTGGAEHNRALAHLINKHRLEYKDERIFGFMDNKFDFKNRIKHLHNFKYEESFLMGLNQPVSGYNVLFSAREDNNKGESSNINAKLLGYRLKDKDKLYNVLSIYGFSALASVFGMHYLVAEIANKSNFNTQNLEDAEKSGEWLINKGIFQDKYLQAFNHSIDTFNPDNIQYINKGLSSIIAYKKDPNKILSKNFNKKLHLFVFNSDIELYKKTFLFGTKESIVDNINIGARRTLLKVDKD